MNIKIIAVLMLISAGQIMSQDSVYTITAGQLVNSLSNTREEIEKFSEELQTYQGKSLNEKGIKYISEKQKELNSKIKSYRIIYEYIPEPPDVFRRNLNEAINISLQNSERVKSIIDFTGSKGSQSLSWLVQLIKPILIAQFPYLETIINSFLK